MSGNIAVSPYNPVQQAGVRAKNPPDLVIAFRAPTTTDYGYFLGTNWLYVGNSYWGLLSTVISPSTKTANWAMFGGVGSGITQINGDSGSTNGPIVTFTGGTTGLNFAVAGTTATLTGGPIVPLTWVSTDGTGAPLTMPINSAYVTTGAASFQLNLPTASALGSQVKVIVSGTGTITVNGSAGGAAGQMNIEGIVSGAGNNFVSTVSPGNTVTFRSIAAGNNQLWIADSVTGGWNPT